MSTNLEYRERQRQRKRESRRQVSEAQQEKNSDRDLEREVKDKRDIFLSEEQHENFCSGGGKIRNVSGHQGENMRQ